jgi:hypothetical protein
MSRLLSASSGDCDQADALRLREGIAMDLIVIAARIPVCGPVSGAEARIVHKLAARGFGRGALFSMR